MAASPQRRFILAHGFTQTARSWDVIGDLLRSRVPGAAIVAVDMPGHGRATDVVAADLWESADHLIGIGGRGTYIGYSMGGRVALHAALSHPDAVERLVLIGATAGIDDDAERAERRLADDALAERIEAIGVDAFIDEWLAAPLFAGLDASNDQRPDRLRNTAAGLAASLHSTGTGTQTPLWDRLGEIDVPVLVIVGELDVKFTELGTRLVGRLPCAELSVVPAVGHSVHLEAPRDTADAIADWVERTSRS